VAVARLAGNPDIAVIDHPQYLQAKAQVDEAQRELDHTVVKAPFAGIVTNVPSIAPGKSGASDGAAAIVKPVSRDVPVGNLSHEDLLGALPYVQGSVAASQDQIDWVLTSS